ncbi:type VI secretion system baseplate subunit TssK [Nannocystis sp. SCPEA4]|uniref:type VI secretion system baseplate subunit TssK n=1 Tax=Nannocystis sp. SCPEA4 TaxID=2996787 RepID=UPI002271266D|nr:type VI secretion system baseplate subunit TssK [Nannocystis sp. SCPEA4]MCY1059596.1 type VI secretion system baseplate subunit TssK [Nannocystis sp. SCPEA4]
MNGSRLALPAWQMGQVLLPEQFDALEEALLAHDAARAAFSGLPSYGLARLALDEDQLAEGALHIERLTYVFPSGLLVDAPGNAVVGNCNLRAVEGNAASIFLHVGKEVTDAADLKVYSDDSTHVTRVIFRAELSLAARREHARESAKLLGLVRRDNRWALDAYAPPMLRVGVEVAPLLRDVLERAARAVQAVEAQLSRRIRDSFLGSDQGAELRRVRAAAHRALAVLADHGFGGAEAQQQVSLHPYFLFAALREFFMEAAILEDEHGDVLRLRYRHGDLAGCFEELRRRIEGCLGASSLSSKRLEFERRAGWYVAGPFPEGLRESREVYLIVKSNSGESLQFDGVKLASPRRIEDVYTRALSGVSLTAFKSSAFAYVYGQDAVFYRLQTEGDAEWSQAVRDGDLCFPAWREIEGIQAVLVWE